MAQQISINVYAIPGQTSGFPMRMTFPTQGFSTRPTSQVINGVSCYGIISYGQTQAIVIETPATLATLSNA